ncbi:cupin domain-containing protein, partial [Methylobacterium sp. J-001]|uniref:cupin domain-containing protein n=1 Tax=Methylobacterium sp. J-001 TaxID=2836609 RepID=UPI001FB8A0B0
MGANALHMQLLEITPGERAHAHKHESHETAIHVLSGISGCFWGEHWENHVIAGAGEFVYIAAAVPPLPYNRSQTEPAPAVIARPDPNEPASVVLPPAL